MLECLAAADPLTDRVAISQLTIMMIMMTTFRCQCCCLADITVVVVPAVAAAAAFTVAGLNGRISYSQS